MTSVDVGGRARWLRGSTFDLRAFAPGVLSRAQKLFWRLEDGPLRRILSNRPVMWLRTTICRNLKEMKADEVLEVLDDLDRAGVQAWLVGGWGVDALLQRRTRRHSDIDLVVLTQDGSSENACEVLGRLGFEKLEEGDVPGAGMPRRILFDDGSGRSVDLHPIDTSVALFASDTSPGELDPSAFATGMLAGRAVPCVSVACQVSLKSYPGARAKDVRDIEQLRQLTTTLSGLEL